LNTLVIVFGPKFYNIYISKEWMLPDIKGGRVARASADGAAELRSPSAALRGGASGMPQQAVSPGTKHARGDAKLLGAGTHGNGSSSPVVSQVGVSSVKLNVDTNASPAVADDNDAPASPSSSSSPAASGSGANKSGAVPTRKLSTLNEDDEINHRASVAV
jgi:hypothetical protein